MSLKKEFLIKLFEELDRACLCAVTDRQESLFKFREELREELAKAIFYAEVDKQLKLAEEVRSADADNCNAPVVVVAPVGSLEFQIAQLLQTMDSEKWLFALQCEKNRLQSYLEIDVDSSQPGKSRVKKRKCELESTAEAAMAGLGYIEKIKTNPLDLDSAFSAGWSAAWAFFEERGLGNVERRGMCKYTNESIEQRNRRWQEMVLVKYQKNREQKKFGINERWNFRVVCKRLARIETVDFDTFRKAVKNPAK
jgi:hypothetical protein